MCIRDRVSRSCVPLFNHHPRRTATNAVASCDSSRLSAPTTHLIWTTRYWSARSADVNILVQLTTWAQNQTDVVEQRATAWLIKLPVIERLGIIPVQTCQI